MMRRHPVLAGALAIALAAASAACGGGGRDSDDPLATSTPPAPTPTPTPTEALVHGQPVSAFFQDSCSGCHGADRRGATGPALLPARLTQPDDYYFGVIERGKTNSIMPGWGTLLSKAEIDALIAFIRTEPSGGPVTWTRADIEASLVVLRDEATLPDRPTHGGNLDNLFLVTERESQRIAVIDGDSHTLLDTIPASYRAHGYTFSPADERWAYNMGRDGWVFKIDLYTLQAVRKVRIGIDSRAIAISDDGKVLIAGNYIPATAVLLDAETLAPLQVVDTTATDPEGETVASRVATIVDTSPEKVGPYFLVALKEAGQVWRIDWSDPSFPIVKLPDVGHILHDGFLSPDNSRFYLASQRDSFMAAIDVASMTLVARIATGETPHPGSGAA
jgi:mono/diheme cytochrome c family protein